MKIEDALRLADREYDSDLTGSPLFPEACSTLARALLAEQARSADLEAQLAAERERSAALEAALQAEVRALVARNDYTPGSEGYASRQIVIEELRAILSGGTAALDAHDAALLGRMRARVEAVLPFIVDGGRTVAVLHADVLAAIDAKEDK